MFLRPARPTKGGHPPAPARFPLSDTPTNVATINRVRGSPPRHPDRYRTRGNTTMTEQPIRLTGPADLADAIPHLFGCRAD